MVALSRKSRVYTIDKVVEPTPTPGPAPGPPSPAPLVGPSLPPTEEDVNESFPLTSADDEATPQSPYTANRNLIHSLTLPPTIPSIPPSPPGSPKPALAQKFAHFRKLKSQGVHFNEKLLRSSALNNPSLLQKLSAFVGLENEDFYATNMKPDIWDPSAFPKEAFVEALDKNQEKIAKEREENRAKEAREKVEFVSSAEKKPNSRWGVVDRVQGNEREQKNTPPVRERRDRDDRKDDRRSSSRRDERDGGRNEGDRDRRREDDREKKRRRTRSRSRGKERERDREGRYRDYEYRSGR